MNAGIYENELTGSETAEAYLKTIDEEKINLLDTVLLITMWFLALVASVKNYGYYPGILFLVISVFLVIRNPINGLMVLLLLFYIPATALNISRIFYISSFIAGTGYIIHGLYAKYRPPFLNALTILSMILVLFISSTILIAPDHATAIDYTSRYIEGFLATILTFALINTKNDLIKTLKWWVIVGALTFIFCAVHYVFGSNTALAELSALRSPAGGDILYRTRAIVEGLEYTRFLWPGADPNYLSCNLLFPVGISLAFLGTVRPAKKMFWLISSGIISINILATFSRSGALALFFLITLYLMRRNIRAAIPTVMLVLAGLILIPMIPGLSDRLFGIGTAIETGASGRFQLWSNALKMWTQSPVIGNGIGAFYATYGDATHNTYLQLSAETGTIGVFLYGIIILVSLFQCQKISKLYLDKNTTDVVFSKILMVGLIGTALMMATITFQDVKLFWMECVVCYLLYKTAYEQLVQYAAAEDTEQLYLQTA